MNRAILAGLSVLAFSAVQAGAADIPMKAAAVAPMIAVAPTWTGCYIGGNAGGGWARNSATWTGVTEGGTAFATGAATVVPAASNGDYNGTGFVGGGQIGCNYQIGAFVLGAEADAQYTGIKGSRAAVSLGNTNGGPATIVPGTIAESFDSKWLATFRGRAGIASGQWLFYVTGGAAVADVTFNDQLCFGATAAVPGCNTSSVKNNRLGWAFGGGIEWMFANNWTVKAEYLYVDLGTTSATSLFTAAGGGNPFPQATITHNNRFVESIGRVGLNYKF
jgi:outer membrane immunogenic protein